MISRARGKTGKRGVGRSEFLHDLKLLTTEADVAQKEGSARLEPLSDLDEDVVLCTVLVREKVHHKAEEGAVKLVIRREDIDLALDQDSAIGGATRVDDLLGDREHVGSRIDTNKLKVVGRGRENLDLTTTSGANDKETAVGLHFGVEGGPEKTLKTVVSRHEFEVCVILFLCHLELLEVAVKVLGDGGHGPSLGAVLFVLHFISTLSFAFVCLFDVRPRDSTPPGKQ